MECPKPDDIRIFIMIVITVSTFVTIISTWLLKNKELKHKLTEEKLKQIYSKEIEVYEELYTLTLEYDRQEHYIGRENLDIKDWDESDYTLHTRVVEKMLSEINKNIFYISEALEEKFTTLQAKYLKDFIEYKNFRSEYPKISPKFIDHNTDDGSFMENPLLTKKKELLDKAQKKFYTDNEEEIDNLLKCIKEEFKDKRNYKDEGKSYKWLKEKCYFISKKLWTKLSRIKKKI